MTRVFIDVNIPMYAGGTLHALREPARRVIRAIGVMLHHQIPEIITADTGFDAVKEIRRIDPTTF